MEAMKADMKRNDPVYRLPLHVRHTRYADSGVVIDIDHGRMFRLNQVGSRMLEFSSGGDMAEAEIVDRIATEFGTDIETTAQDAKRFFNQLKQLGVVEEPIDVAGHFSTRNVKS